LKRRKIFVVSGDTAVSDSIRELVETVGLQAETFHSLLAFLNAVEAERRGCLVLDTHSGDLSNQEQQRVLADCCARMTVILIAERGDVETAVSAMKAGAMDVVQKPYRDNKLLGSIEKGLEFNVAAEG
jgi:FixJ family two-component response regulator